MPSLVLNGENLSVRRESRCLVISRKLDEAQDAVLTVRLEDVERVIVMGHPSLPVSVLQQLMKRGIPVSLISERGHWYGTVHPDTDLNAQRRLAQYRQQGTTAVRCRCAAKIVGMKIRNQRRFLQRLRSNRGLAETQVQQTIERLRELATQAEQASDLPGLRGLEGAASAQYFQSLRVFIPEDMGFKKRNRRPPQDPTNALLSFCYTMVLSEVVAAVRSQGLDPCLGWLHETAAGKTALAFDLLEPLRTPVCDALVLNLLNHSILKSEDFYRCEEDGGVYLSEQGRKTFFVQYEKQMQRSFKHPQSGLHTNFRQCIVFQTWGVLRLLDDPECQDNGLFQMP